MDENSGENEEAEKLQEAVTLTYLQQTNRKTLILKCIHIDVL